MFKEDRRRIKETKPWDIRLHSSTQLTQGRTRLKYRAPQNLKISQKQLGILTNNLNIMRLRSSVGRAPVEIERFMVRSVRGKDT